jgi:transposase
VHVRAEGGGKPITLVLTPGQAAESQQMPALMDSGTVKRSGRGRPRKRPRRIVGDRGYCGQPVVQFLRRRGIRTTIPKRKNMNRQGPFNKELYRRRNRVERLIGRFKQYRRIATRYEKRGENYRAMWVLASILMWL